MDKYLSFAEYQEGADSLQAVSGMILFSFAKHAEDTKDIIIRDIIARSTMMLKGIYGLWEISDYQDAWIRQICRVTADCDSRLS